MKDETALQVFKSVAGAVTSNIDNLILELFEVTQMAIDYQKGEVKRYLKKITDFKFRSMKGKKTRKGKLHYDSVAHFILKYGKQFDHFSEVTFPKMPDKKCYANSTRMLLEHRELFYCEGYAIAQIGNSMMLPVSHAWLCDKDDGVIELTWRTRGLDYFGVKLRTNGLIKLMFKNKYHGFIDNWADDFPVLRIPPSRLKGYVHL